jgi:putative modified peptide
MANKDNARKLLQRLAEDDAFREHMQTDPVAAFAEYGFKIDPGIAPNKIELPSKYEISKNMDLLSQQMEATSGWIVFCR